MGVVEGFEERLDHAVKFVVANFTVRGVVFELSSGLLAPSSCFERCFFEEQFLQVVSSVEVSLFA